MFPEINNQRCIVPLGLLGMGVHMGQFDGGVPPKIEKNIFQGLNYFTWYPDGEFCLK